MQRYFLNEVPNAATFELDNSTFHHFITVLRGKVGSKAEFVLPDGETLLTAEVTAMDEQTAVMRIVDRFKLAVELPVKVHLLLGLAKGDKPEFVVQKATELGVSTITFIETEWSVVHWGQKSERKLERLNKIAQAASEQSHRTIVPAISYLARLSDLPALDGATKIVAWEESAKKGERATLPQAFAQLSTGDDIYFLVGPEGGLTQGEVKFLVEARGFKAAGLGPRILRAETAPLYALSSLSYQLELNNRL
jgi:16S rRNA (uracil1498-N3)-methyltransferase